MDSDVERYDVTELIDACGSGDQRAWAELHARFGPLVLRTVYSFRLQPADAQDVCQLVWQRVFKALPALRATDKLYSWLVTVARREALRHVGRAKRDVPVGGMWEFDGVPGTDAGPEESAVVSAEHETVRAALRQLPHDQQQLMALLFADPPIGYDRISVKLGIPRGSIGPMRMRNVERLRKVYGNG